MSDSKYLLMTPYHGDYNCTHNFLQTDTEELYLQNKKLRGPSWEWYNRPITYKLNSLGYRMDKNVEDVDFDNYFAFFGCSFVAGIGMAQEDLFAHRIAKQYNKDYINAGMGGSGTEFILYNLTKLLTDAPRPPKAVVINWPEPTRTLLWRNGHYASFLIGFTGDTNDPWWSQVYGYWNEAFHKIAMEESHILNRTRMIQSAVRLMCRQSNIVLFETAFAGTENIFKPEVEFINWREEYARDVKLDNSGGHPGKYFHDEVVTRFDNFIKRNRIKL